MRTDTYSSQAQTAFSGGASPAGYGQAYLPTIIISFPTRNIPLLRSDPVYWPESSCRKFQLAVNTPNFAKGMRDKVNAGTLALSFKSDMTDHECLKQRKGAIYQAQLLDWEPHRQSLTYLIGGRDHMRTRQLRDAKNHFTREIHFVRVSRQLTTRHNPQNRCHGTSRHLKTMYLDYPEYTALLTSQFEPTPGDLLVMSALWTPTKCLPIHRDTSPYPANSVWVKPSFYNQPLPCALRSP